MEFHFQINYEVMVKEWPQAPGEHNHGIPLKKIKTSGISRKVLSNEEKLQMMKDLDEFSKESCERNQIYIYLSLFLLLFTVVTLIVIT